MKLNSKQISRIKTKINLGEKKMIVRINVTEDDGAEWTDDEISYNIYCVDENYNIIWQVKEIKTKPSFDDGDPFYYLGKNSNGEIIADRFSGFVYRIDRNLTARLRN